MTKRRVSSEPRRYWTPEDIATVRRRYPGDPTSAIAADLGRKTQSVYAMATKLGLRKSPEYMDSPAACRLRRGDNVGAAHRFKPGHVPWTKGTHFVAGGRSAETRFKKGQRPHTWKPIGSTRAMDGYLQRKVTDTGYTPRDWRPVHILLWEEHNGPVPAGHALAFRDGNREHITLENLELLSRAELMKRNTLHNLPKELARVIQLRGAVNRQINKRERRERDQQHRSAEDGTVRDTASASGSDQPDGHRSRKGRV